MAESNESGSIWDSLGESLTGLFDTSTKAAGAYVTGVAEAKSAAPEENRVTQESIAQEPTGQVSANNTTTSDSDKYIRYGLYGVAGLAVLAILFLLIKGR